MREQYAALPLLLDPVLSTPAALQPGAFPCPKCGKALRRQKSRQNADEFFWSCSDADCRTFLPDEDGKPGKPRERAIPSEYPCPVCGRPLYSGKNDRGTYWACYNKQGHPDGNNVFLPDDNGTPGQPKEKSPRVVTEFTCPDCGKALLYRQGTSKAGKPYEVFSCSGYPNCKTSFWGKDGKPDFYRRPK